MRITEVRLKEIIREEVARRLFETILDDLVVEELKRIGITETDENHEAFRKQAAAMSRRTLLQGLGAMGVLGLGGAGIDYLEKAWAFAKHGKAHARNAEIDDATAAAKEILGDYTGPYSSGDKAAEFWFSQDFSAIDEHGNEQFLDRYKFPKGSFQGIISANMTQHDPRYYLSAAALDDLPIPKMGANSGVEANAYLYAKLEGPENALQMGYKDAVVRHLDGVYEEVVRISQGASGKTGIIVKREGKPIRVMLPTWSIKFEFLVTELNALPPEEQEQFKGATADREDERTLGSTYKGKKVALAHGFEKGADARQAWADGEDGVDGDYSADDYRNDHPEDRIANLGGSFFVQGFEFGIGGCNKPRLPGASFTGQKTSDDGKPTQEFSAWLDRQPPQTCQGTPPPQVGNVDLTDPKL